MKNIQKQVVIQGEKKSSANRHSVFGPVINPHSLNQENKRLAGGSSGGSAASVAMNMCRV